ncbi:3-hydroxyacyl-ACP dehydratase FabZ [Enterococcus nangangensis]|uniref:3-hydroxyacyl-ACP dehydratase FabZ n=1 Tax=Enterococcus nangangensis TaxID=2559926 RepID=UPI0010F608B3|nr:3-hydroxyacyl-ACP dehydratase FabZ [Enterococcus nangangensis]
MDIQAIMQILPHRPPFLLLDRVTEITAEKVVALKNVTMNEPFFVGHFPGEPVMPGVLIVEALAQAGAVVLLSKPEFKGQTAYFGGLDKVRFKQKVVPGDQLVLEVTLKKLVKNVGQAVGVAKVQGRVVAQCEMTFACS